MSKNSFNDVEANEKNNIPEYVPLWSFSSTRFLIALILMFVVLCALNMRTNIGMAMVCMVNSTAYSSKSYENGSETELTSVQNSTCYIRKNSNTVKDLGYHGTYLWDPQMQSALISSTAYGSFFTILLSGYISDRYGPRIVCMGALVLYTTITILSPILAQWNYYVFLFGRSVMGLAEGCIFPAVAALISKWFPSNERATVAAIYTSGNQIGSSMGTFLAARFCLLTFLGGWPLIFYMYGILGLMCTILWYLFATNKPEECKFISEKEKNYLEYHLSASGNKKQGKKSGLNVPWIKIFTSLPVWACVLTRFSFAWNSIVMGMLLPSYFRDVLNLDMSNNGLFTAIPLVVQLFSKNLIAFLSDNLKKSGRVGITTSTKIVQTFSSVGSCLAIFGLVTFVDCTRPYLALIFLAMYGFCLGGLISGAYTATLCLAPEFSGTIESMTGFLGVIAYITSAMTAGFINKTGSASEWTIIFIITGSLILVAGIFFLIFGSADVQEWSKFFKENTSKEKIFVVPHPKIYVIPEKSSTEKSIC